MGRKLIRRVPTERDLNSKLAKGHIAIIYGQHLLLYSSLYVIASTAYLIHTGTFTKDLLPAAVVLMFAGCVSLICICLCNATAWRSSQPAGRNFFTSPACLETLSKNAVRFAATAWMVASGLVVAFTVAGHPSCLISERAKLYSPAIDVGSQCIVQRASVAASIMAMVVSIGLVLLTWKTTDPYLAHLLGVHKRPQLLPFVLPYNKGDRPMFSEMSFKCRSTSTFSSYTIAEPNEDTLYTLYPTRPEKAYGLGIYAPKTSAASFLTPRPSLRTIRSQASFGHRPLKSSPVPPLPVYDPEKYKDMPSMQKISQPPKRTYTLRRKANERAFRAVQCPPLPSNRKTNTLNRSASKESLSSVYSRSVSGDSPDPSSGPLVGRISGRQPNSLKATKNIGRSPFNTKQPEPGMVIGSHLGLQENHLRETLDEKPDAPSRLPIVRAVSTFGNVQDWTATKASNGKPIRTGHASTWSQRCDLPPLPVERARVGGR